MYERKNYGCAAAHTSSFEYISSCRETTIFTFSPTGILRKSATTSSLVLPAKSIPFIDKNLSPHFRRPSSAAGPFERASID